MRTRSIEVSDGQLAKMCFTCSFVAIMSCDCTGMRIAEMCIRSRGALRCCAYHRSGNNISPLSVCTSLLRPYFHTLSVLCMHTRHYISVPTRMKQHVLSRTSNFRSKRCIQYHVICSSVSIPFNLCLLCLLTIFYFRLGGVRKVSVSAFDCNVFAHCAPG